MKLTDTIIKKIEACTTPNQVFSLLNKHNITIDHDDTSDVGCFSIWLDDTTRIYKPLGRKTMRYQTWQRFTPTYSGVTVFFG